MPDNIFSDFNNADLRTMLQWKEEWLRVSPVGKICVNMKDRRIESVNNAALKMFGFSVRGQMIGLSIHDLVPLDPDVHEQHIVTWEKTMEAKLIGNGSTVLRGVRRREDGTLTTFHCGIYIAPVQHPNDQEMPRDTRDPPRYYAYLYIFDYEKMGLAHNTEVLDERRDYKQEFSQHHDAPALPESIDPFSTLADD